LPSPGEVDEGHADEREDKVGAANEDGLREGRLRARAGRDQGAVEAIPALLVAVRDSNEGVQKVARETLEKISPFSTPARAA